MNSENQKRIKSLITFILLTAGENDDYTARSLGPIHILKYLYLADYYYAKRNQGSTYTGIDWTFHNFGPWSFAAFEMIEPALAGSGATLREFDNSFGDQDSKRWTLNNSDFLNTLAQKIPAAITRQLRSVMREFVTDTCELLHFVYNTEPMLKAAPGEQLRFGEESMPQTFEVTETRLEKLSKNKRKAFSQRISSLKDKVKSGHFSSSSEVESKLQPRYDEVYYQGLESFDMDDCYSDGDVITVKFSDDIWKSGIRNKIDS